MRFRAQHAPLRRVELESGRHGVIVDDPLRLRVKKSRRVSQKATCTGLKLLAGIFARAARRGACLAPGRVWHARSRLVFVVLVLIGVPRPAAAHTQRHGAAPGARRPAQLAETQVVGANTAPAVQCNQCRPAAAGTKAQRAGAARQVAKRAWERRAAQRPARELQRASPAAPPRGGLLQAPAWRTEGLAVC